jgi:hypothetical protein
MKTYKFFLSVIVFILLFENGNNAQTSYYYCYRGEKQYLNSDKSRLFVSVADTNKLNEVLNIQNRMELVMPNNLSANQYQDGEALIKQSMEPANAFYESNLFQSAEPDRIVENLSACTNDTYFSNRWGLKNTLMSISNNLGTPSTLMKQQLAGRINRAWQHGADVISNSWAHDELAGDYTDAVNNATSQGRNGLGCVLAFCTQNWNSSVAYPATLPNVLAVGAVSFNFTNQTVTSNTTVAGCNINVQNVTVIQNDFEVEAGSEPEIK